MNRACSAKITLLAVLLGCAMEVAAREQEPVAPHDHGTGSQAGAGILDQSHQHDEMVSPEMAMDPSGPSTGPADLRDPHAYSGGYELSSGLYALESESMIQLADQTVFAGLWMDRFEHVTRDGIDVSELEGHAWFGGSYNRILLRTELEMEQGSVEVAEIDLMGSHAITPFWNFQYGIRHSIINDNHRHWAMLGLNGLAPYWFEVDASLFVSERGQTFYDLEAEYEILLTQRLVLQPRIDIHSYGKADEEVGQGSGLATLKFGARLRYEFNRQFAPYIGVERVSRFGKTSDLLPSGVDGHEIWWLAGLKFWF